MGKLAVKYVGPIQSFSGYGEANRTFIRALSEVGIDVTTQTLYYDNNKINFFGKDYEFIKTLENQPLNYDIKIIHIPCDSYVKHLEPCKYHIGHLFWETDRMSPEWAWNCNLMDEIWTGSEFNKKAFERSGVKVPIWIFPEAFDMAMVNVPFEKWEIPGHEGFLFLSIFQWIQRKNPKALISAYLSEFGVEEKVGLVIKTYKDKFGDLERNQISEQIWQWKRDLGKIKGPPIYLNVELMEKTDVFRLYETADCFVLPHRGEGFGRIIAEALAMKKPVIATNLGGVHDWLTKECYYPLSYKEVGVFGMDFAPWYRRDQKWAEVDVNKLRQKMRYVFEHREEAKETGMRGYQFVKDNFSYEAVGRMMKDRLIDIQKMLEKKKEEGIWLKN